MSIDAYKPVAVGPIYDFEYLSEEFQKRHGRSIRDYHSLLEHPGHFARWVQSIGEGEATSVERQQEQYRRYITDPNGHSAAPPYFDFWHWLLDLGETMMEWTERRGYRDKIVLVFPELVPEQTIMTPDDEDQFRERMNKLAGRVSDDMRPHVDATYRDMITARNTKHRDARAVIDLLVDDHDVPVHASGRRIMTIYTSVSC